MSSGFKDQTRRDLANVFHNADEHADNVNVHYNGVDFFIPVVIDGEGAKVRTTSMRDNADGVFIADMTAYISFYDLKIVPRKETKIIIDGTAYNIFHVQFDAGSITLDLEVLDE